MSALCICVLLLSLTINIHVDIEGENAAAAAAVPPRVNHTDVGPTVSGLDPWQFSHCAGLWHNFALHGQAIRSHPGDFSDSNFGYNTGNQPQGALQRNIWKRDDSNWRGEKTSVVREVLQSFNMK